MSVIFESDDFFDKTALTGKTLKYMLNMFVLDVYQKNFCSNF